MRKFAECWPDRTIVQRTVAQIPWRSNLALLDKLQDMETRLWYARRTIDYGWGKDMLAIQIDTRLQEREGKAIQTLSVYGSWVPFWPRQPKNVRLSFSPASLTATAT